jgi:hypothetical protein
MTETEDVHERRAGPNVPAIAGGAVIAGFLVAAILLIVIGGNPFSDTNEVVYRDIVVGSVSPGEDQLCWSDRPGERDAPQECAILTLDPEGEVPEAGDEVTVGLVRLATPDGDQRQQIIFVSDADVVGDGDADEAPQDGAETS